MLVMIYSVGPVKNFRSDRRLQTVMATDGMVKFEVQLFYIYILLITKKNLKFFLLDHINLDQDVG